MIKIFTDSDGDMPRDIAKEYGIEYIPFGISYGGDDFIADFYELTAADFYKKLRTSDSFPKTSQPTFAQYEEKLKPALQHGHDVICFTITGKFSGSIQSGKIAEETLKEEFPERKVTVIDSHRCTALHGYLVYQAARLAADGMGYDDIVAKVLEIRDDYKLFVTVDSLEYLRKGGRLGKAGALLGSLLNIKPIIEFGDGELHPYSKVRSKKNAMSEIVRLLEKSVNGALKDYTAAALCCDDALARDEMAEGLKRAGFQTLFWDIGPVVGAHLGPSGFAAFVCKKINDKY